MEITPRPRMEPIRTPKLLRIHVTGLMSFGYPAPHVHEWAKKGLKIETLEQRTLNRSLAGAQGMRIGMTLKNRIPTGGFLEGDSSFQFSVPTFRSKFSKPSPRPRERVTTWEGFPCGELGACGSFDLKPPRIACELERPCAQRKLQEPSTQRYIIQVGIHIHPPHLRSQPYVSVAVCFIRSHQLMTYKSLLAV